jgi:hypothetical protein
MVKVSLTRSLNCRHVRDPNLKNLGVLEALLKKRMGPHMGIEILDLFGFALTVIVPATIAYKRRMDVLYGPYMRGRPGGLSVKRFWQPSSSAIDRLFELEGQKMIYLDSIGAY